MNPQWAGRDMRKAWRWPMPTAPSWPVFGGVGGIAPDRP